MEQRSKVIDFSQYNGDVAKEICAEVFSFSNRNLFEREEDSVLEENKIIEKYLDKVDQDRRDQEERISKNIELMEKRIIEDRRLSEDRMEKRYLEVMNSTEKTNNNIDEKVKRIEDKMDDTKKWIIGLCLTTILGIAAMVITVVLK